MAHPYDMAQLMAMADEVKADYDELMGVEEDPEPPTPDPEPAPAEPDESESESESDESVEEEDSEDEIVLRSKPKKRAVPRAVKGVVDPFAETRSRLRGIKISLGHSKKREARMISEVDALQQKVKNLEEDLETEMDRMVLATFKSQLAEKKKQLKSLQATAKNNQKEVDDFNRAMEKAEGRGKAKGK